MDKYLELGAVTVLFFFAIREFFVYLKTRKNGIASVSNDRLLEELKLTNTNHLLSIEKSLNDGFDRLNDTIRNGNEKQIEILGEIKGILSKTN